MGHATDSTVLGDFSNASFEHFGVRSRFFRRDGKFMVDTDGPDGKPGEFEIKYTFGVYPLRPAGVFSRCAMASTGVASFGASGVVAKRSANGG